MTQSGNHPSIDIRVMVNSVYLPARVIQAIIVEIGIVCDLFSALFKYVTFHNDLTRSYSPTLPFNVFLYIMYSNLVWFGVG